MDLGSIGADRVEEILLRHGAQAVSLTDAGDDPVLEPAPGTTPLWRDTRITALFAAGADFEDLRADLGQTLAIEVLPDNHVTTLEDCVWEREWLKDFRPMRFGERLWVSPEGGMVEADNAVVRPRSVRDPVKHLAVAGVEHQEVPGQLAREEQFGRCRRNGRQHRMQ